MEPRNHLKDLFITKRSTRGSQLQGHTFLVRGAGGATAASPPGCVYIPRSGRDWALLAPPWDCSACVRWPSSEPSEREAIIIIPCNPIGIVVVQVPTHHKYLHAAAWVGVSLLVSCLKPDAPSLSEFLSAVMMGQPGTWPFIPIHGPNLFIIGNKSWNSSQHSCNSRGVIKHLLCVAKRLFGFIWLGGKWAFVSTLHGVPQKSSERKPQQWVIQIRQKKSAFVVNKLVEL